MNHKTRLVLLNLFGDDYMRNHIHSWEDGEFIFCIRKSYTYGNGLTLYKIISNGTEEYGFYQDKRPEIISMVELSEDFNIVQLRNIIKH